MESRDGFGSSDKNLNEKYYQSSRSSRWLDAHGGRSRDSRYESSRRPSEDFRAGYSSSQSHYLNHKSSSSSNEKYRHYHHHRHHHHHHHGSSGSSSHHHRSSYSSHHSRRDSDYSPRGIDEHYRHSSSSIRHSSAQRDETIKTSQSSSEFLSTGHASHRHLYRDDDRFLPSSVAYEQRHATITHSTDHSTSSAMPPIPNLSTTTLSVNPAFNSNPFSLFYEKLKNLNLIEKLPSFIVNYQQQQQLIEANNNVLDIFEKNSNAFELDHTLGLSYFEGKSTKFYSEYYALMELDRNTKLVDADLKLIKNQIDNLEKVNYGLWSESKWTLSSGAHKDMLIDDFELEKLI